MRIAIVAPLVSAIAEPHSGGSQALLADLAAGLAGRGHEVDVYAARGSRIEGANLVDTGIDPEDLAGDLFRSGDSGRKPSRAGREAFGEIYLKIRQGNYDLVHNHAFDVPAINPPVGLQAPLIHTLHLPFEDRIARAISDARSSGARPTIAAVSVSQAHNWQPVVDFDVVVPNGVPCDRIDYSERAGASLIFAGRLSAEKGALEAVEIARQAAVALLIVGGAYDPRYASEVAEAAKRAAGDSDIVIEPPLPRSYLWRRMAACAAMLCPVGWEEPFGLAAAEAQACGTPVIAFNRGGLREVVRHGQTGTLVEPGDIDAAAAAALNCGDLSRKACRDHAESNLDLKKCLDAHEALYRSVVSGALAAGIG